MSYRWWSPASSAPCSVFVVLPQAKSENYSANLIVTSVFISRFFFLYLKYEPAILFTIFFLNFNMLSISTNSLLKIFEALFPFLFNYVGEKTGLIIQSHLLKL